MKRIILGVVGLIIAGAIIIGNTPFLNAQTETGADGKVEGEVVGGSEATVDVPTLSFDKPVEEPQEEPEEPEKEPEEEPQEEPEEPEEPEETQYVIIPEEPTVPETAEQTPTPVAFVEESKIVVSTYDYEDPAEAVVEDAAVEGNIVEEIIVPASEEEELVPACTEEELLVVADEEEEIQTPDVFNTTDYILFGAATLIIIGGLFSIIKFVRG